MENTLHFYRFNRWVFLCSFKKLGTSFSSTIVTINFILSSILVHFDVVVKNKQTDLKKKKTN